MTLATVRRPTSEADARQRVWSQACVGQVPAVPRPVQRWHMDEEFELSHEQRSDGVVVAVRGGIDLRKE